MNKKNLLILGLLTVFLAGCNNGLIKKRSLNTKSWGYEQNAIDPISGSDTRVERFEVRTGDCGRNSGWNDCKTDRERSEISVGPNLSVNGNYWVGYYIYIPEDFVSSSKVKTTLGQIHMRGGFSGSAGGHKSFPPLIQLNAFNDVFLTQYHRLTGSANNIIDVSDTRELIKLTDMKGKWTHIMMNLQSKGRISTLEIFVDGVLKEIFEQSLPRAPSSYYLKYGIYRSFVSKHGSPMPTQIAYYKDVSISSSRAEVDPFYDPKSSVMSVEAMKRKELIEKEKHKASVEALKTIEGKKTEACADKAFVLLTGISCNN